MKHQALDLDHDRFLRLHGAQRVHVMQGCLWLTIDHEPVDHVLTRGQGIDLPEGAHALVQALEVPARLIIEPAAPWWRRAMRALRGSAETAGAASAAIGRPA